MYNAIFRDCGISDASAISYFLLNDLVELASIFLLLIERKGCTEQNLFYYEAEWLQLKECDSVIENTDSALLSDEMAHLLSSCLSVRVTAEKCGVRTVTEDQLATKADWQVTETGDKTWIMLHDKNLQELYQLTSDVKTL